MTWLKKVGQFLAQGVERAAEFFPFLSPLAVLLPQGGQKAVQAIGTDLGALQNIVVAVETVNQAPGSGAQKLAAAIPLVTTFIKNSEVMIGKKVANEALFAQACQEFAQATVDLLNSIDPPSDPS
jgi:hypothetical protein